MLKNSISCFYMFADTEETWYRTKQTEAIADHLGDVEEEGDDTGGGEEHIRGKLKVLKFALIVLLNFIFCKKIDIKIVKNMLLNYMLQSSRACLGKQPKVTQIWISIHLFQDCGQICSCVVGVNQVGKVHCRDQSQQVLLLRGIHHFLFKIYLQGFCLLL